MIRPRIASVITRKQEEGHKITHRGIAIKLGKSPQQFSEWVQGKKIPRLDTAFEIAHALNCTVDELYEYTPGEAQKKN